MYEPYGQLVIPSWLPLREAYVFGIIHMYVGIKVS